MGQAIGEGALWLAVLAAAILFGVPLYQHLFVIPVWAGNMPSSLTTYFDDHPGVAHFMYRFWTRGLAASLLALVLALATNWRDPKRALWIGIGLGIFLAVLVWTFVWFESRDFILFREAATEIPLDQIAPLARDWIFRDWLCTAMLLGVLLALIRAVGTRSRTQ